MIEEEETFSSYLFTFEFDPTLSGKEMKKITGMINIPNSNSGETFPLVIMLRGYVDQTIYQTGMGSKNASYFLAENGFLTLAPDFLGYAGSDSEAGNIFESRRIYFSHPTKRRRFCISRNRFGNLMGR